jgi:hypothetical protein
LDVGSETELWINVKELLFDDAYLSKVVEDKTLGSREWKCTISFTTNFSSPPIAWGASQQHHSIPNLLLLRL